MSMTFRLFAAPPGWLGIRFIREGHFVGRAAIIPEERASELLTPAGNERIAMSVGAIPVPSPVSSSLPST